MSRHSNLTQKVETPFGAMYITLEFNRAGVPVGGWINHPMKNPSSEITALIEALSEGLNEACKIG